MTGVAVTAKDGLGHLTCRGPRTIVRRFTSVGAISPKGI